MNKLTFTTINNTPQLVHKIKSTIMNDSNNVTPDTNSIVYLIVIIVAVAGGLYFLYKKSK